MSRHRETTLGHLPGEDEEVYTWFLTNKNERYYNYGDDCDITVSPAFAEMSECVWHLTAEEVSEYHKMFMTSSDLYNFCFLRVHTGNSISVAALKERMVEHRAKVKAEADARSEAAKKAAATRQANKVKREAEKLAKDADLERKLYEELKNKFEAK